VVLRAVAEGDRVVLHVTDHGPGMSPEERERAFDRFWSGDAATGGSRTFGGAGLGLAIVRKLVVADGGEVRLDPTPGGGLDVRLEYPST
jgi:two-component system OmpR family sensor kinase